MSGGVVPPPISFLIRIQDEWVRAGALSRTDGHWITSDFARRAKLPLQPIDSPKPILFNTYVQVKTGKPVTHRVVTDIQLATPDSPEGHITIPNLTFYVIPEGGVAPFEWSVYLKDFSLAAKYREANGKDSDASE